MEIDELHRHMLTQDRRVQEKLMDREGCGFQFQLYDPDGNKLDLWDSQTTVRRSHKGANSPNWKERFIFENSCFNVDVDTFFKKIINDEPGARHKRIQITEHALLRESDPEGLNELLAELQNFKNRHPDFEFEMLGQRYTGWEFEIVYREG